MTICALCTCENDTTVVSSKGIQVTRSEGVEAEQHAHFTFILSYLTSKRAQTAVTPGPDLSCVNNWERKQFITLATQHSSRSTYTKPSTIPLQHPSVPPLYITIVKAHPIERRYPSFKVLLRWALWGTTWIKPLVSFVRKPSYLPETDNYTGESVHHSKRPCLTLAEKAL